MKLYLTAADIADELQVSQRTAARFMLQMGEAPITVERYSVWLRERTSGAPLGPDVFVPRPGTGKMGLVYFIEAMGCDRIKIGFTASSSASARVRDLQTGCPFPLQVIATLPGSVATEERIHTRFRKFRVMPNAEWFHASPILRAYISRAAKS